MTLTSTTKLGFGLLLALGAAACNPSQYGDHTNDQRNQHQQQLTNEHIQRMQGN